MVLVTPGPAVTAATPGTPVKRDTASAAKAAVTSSRSKSEQIHRNRTTSVPGPPQAYDSEGRLTGHRHRAGPGLDFGAKFAYNGLNQVTQVRDSTGVLRARFKPRHDGGSTEKVGKSK